MNIKNFSLKDKFILVTTINSVVLVVFGLFVVFMINQLADISSAIIDHPLEVSNAAYYANIEVLRMEKDLVELSTYSIH